MAGDSAVCKMLIDAKCVVDATASVAALESTDSQIQRIVSARATVDFYLFDCVFPGNS